MGKAIVATPEGADGIDATADEQFVVARDAEELANACVRLLRDEHARARLGAHARAWALEHAWTRAAQEYERVYREARES